MPEMIWFWAVLFIAALIVEGVTPFLVSIWFAAGALVAGICALCSLPVWVQVVAFLLVTVAALIVTRPLVRRITRQKLATNADRNVGAEAIVLKPIGPHQSGEVKTGGLVWMAVPEDDSNYDVGEIVIVKEIRGAKLVVKKA